LIRELKEKVNELGLCLATNNTGESLKTLLEIEKMTEAIKQDLKLQIIFEDRKFI
jgi:hypothetical protein